MKTGILKQTLFALSIIFLFSGIVMAQADLSDPYEILEKYYDAIGGKDNILAEKTNYTEAKIILVGTGLEGTAKTWTEVPLKSRQEVDLKVIKQTGGDNGEYAWSVDTNGKVQIARDEQTEKRRKLAEYQAGFEILNPKSEIFTVSFEGIEKVDETDCYKVKIANSINDDISYYLIDLVSFNMLKTIAVNPQAESHSTFSDFRKVGELLVPFAQDVEILPIGQKQRVEILKYESNPEIDPVLFEPPEKQVKDFTFTKGNSAKNISFQYIEEHLYIPVLINGETRLWCLDTGASATVIDNNIAKGMGLELEGNVKGQGAGNTVDVSFTTMPAFEIEGIKFNEQLVASIDISSIFYKWGLDVDGILGYDFLSRFVIKVDYANELISFFDPETFEYTGDGVVMETPLSGTMFEVDATVDGIHSGKWMVDIGAGGLSFHYPYARDNGMIDMDGISRIGMGAGGTQNTRTAKFNTIEFAGFTVKEPVISWPLQEGQGAFRDAEKIGNLGNTLFRHFVIYFDYANQKMIVEKGDNFGNEFPIDRSGLQMYRGENDQIFIMNVSKGTPGEKAGLEVNDIVKSINGDDIDKLGGLLSIRKMMKKEAGTTYDIAFVRDGKEKKCKLTLSDIY